VIKFKESVQENYVLKHDYVYGYQLKQKYYKSIKQTKVQKYQQQLHQQDHQFNQFYHQYKTSLSSTSNLISSPCNLMIDDENTMEFNQ
jgi:hypothetical protein